MSATTTEPKKNRYYYSVREVRREFMPDFREHSEGDTQLPANKTRLPSLIDQVLSDYAKQRHKASADSAA